MAQTFKIKISVKLWYLLFELIGLFVLLFIILDKQKFGPVKISVIALVGTSILLGLMYIAYIFSYKIEIINQSFSVRKFFTTKTFKVSDITSIDYNRLAFDAYIIKAERKKVVISHRLTNKNAIDRFFDVNGVFKKFPRV